METTAGHRFELHDGGVLRFEDGGACVSFDGGGELVVENHTPAKLDVRISGSRKDRRVRLQPGITSDVCRACAIVLDGGASISAYGGMVVIGATGELGHLVED